MIIFNKISLVSRYSAIISIAFIGIFTFLDVISRYILNKPFTGSNEILELSMAFLISSSLVVATSENKHISVCLFESYISSNPILKRTVYYVIESISALAMLFVSYWIVLNTIIQFESGQTTELLKMPVWILGFVISVYLMATTAILIGKLLFRSEVNND